MSTTTEADTVREKRVRPNPVGTAPVTATAAVYVHPETGADLRVELAPFQGDDPRHLGVGVYLTDETGRRVRGTVLRYDRGVDEAPRVIQWQAPHCADDECGSPCGHTRRRMR